MTNTDLNTSGLSLPSMVSKHRSVLFLVKTSIFGLVINHRYSRWLFLLHITKNPKTML